MQTKTICPYCGSSKWGIYDEQNHWFEDDNGELYEYPVGYLKCLDCGNCYDHADNEDKHHGLNHPYEENHTDSWFGLY